MRRISYILLILIIAVVGCKERKKEILIIGDSISIGYTPFVKDSLITTANVYHNYGNGGSTLRGIDSIYSWIGNRKWDIIHFNFGLHDLCYRNEKGKNDKVNGQQMVPLKDYESKLEYIVSILKKTGAKLIFATTTIVPPDEPGRFVDDVTKYNEIALAVMARNEISVNDLYTASIKIHAKNGKGTDNVHYNNMGYKELADKVIETIRSCY